MDNGVTPAGSTQDAISLGVQKKNKDRKTLKYGSEEKEVGFRSASIITGKKLEAGPRMKPGG